MEKTQVIKLIKLLGDRNKARSMQALEPELQGLLPLYDKLYRICEYITANPELFSELELQSVLSLDHLGDLAREKEKNYELRKKEEEFFASQIDEYEKLLVMLYGYQTQTDSKKIN